MSSPRGEITTARGRKFPHAVVDALNKHTCRAEQGHGCRVTLMSIRAHYIHWVGRERLGMSSFNDLKTPPGASLPVETAAAADFDASTNQLVDIPFTHIS